jgi:hypothetical protein
MKKTKKHRKTKMILHDKVYGRRVNFFVLVCSLSSPHTHMNLLSSALALSIHNKHTFRYVEVCEYQ